MPRPATARSGEAPGGLDWLEPLFTAAQMRALDAWAIDEQGIPSLDLMERAGSEVARVVIERSPPGPVSAVCGKGNNGGDGLVVTRLLAEHGIAAKALLLAPPDELSADARQNHERLLAAGGRAELVEARRIAPALADTSLIVDAMLGTGFEGAPRAPLDAAIGAVNETGAPVVAVDVPSGLNASTGEVEGACVEADVTVTFQHPKVGLWVSPGKAYAGRIEVVDIGIPASGRPAPPGAGLIAPPVLSRVPRRTAATNKFSSGTVLVIGGSAGLTGAVCLACEGAMRAGAGWVRAGVPADLNPVFEVKLTEVMTVPLPVGDSSAAAAAALEAAERADAVVLGPGLGRTEGSAQLALRLMDELDLPLVVDADALNALGGDLERVGQRGAATVLTPHAGELGRLLGRPSTDVAAHRIAAVQEAARRARCIVILKGDDTLVTDHSGERLAVSEGGSPGLATAGTGDVLSGVLAAFLSRRVDPLTASCAAVRAHADAGRGAAARHGVDSVIAGDVVEELPAVLRNR